MATRTVGGQAVNVTKTPKSLMYHVVEVVNDLVAAVNEMRTDSNALSDKILSTPTLAVGSDATQVGHLGFVFNVGGTMYFKAANATGVTLTTVVTLPASVYGAVAFDISTDLTVDSINATGLTTGYTNATLAIAAIPSVATNHIRMGYITIINSTAAFTLGATLSKATVTYTSTTPTAMVVVSAAAVDDISLRELGAP